MEEREFHEGWPRRAAIIGAGTMGLGVAECFVAAGVGVRLADATPELTRRAKERLVERARGHAGAGLISPEAAERGEAGEAAEDRKRVGVGKRGGLRGRRVH